MSDEWLVVIRTILAILSIFVLTKLLGKRQISELSFFEYITGITIGSLAAYICLDLQADWHLGILALGIWALCAIGIEFLQLKSKKARDFIDGKATILIKDGKLLEDNLFKERLTIDELNQQLRKKNIFQLADVEFAIMEPNGDINVLLTTENQPLTPKHLGIQVNPLQESQTVIMDGVIMNEALSTIGLSREWLDTELSKIGVTLDNVFVGQVDGYRQLYVDLYDDVLQIPKPQAPQLLWATLKKCQADLELFALTTEAEEAKKMYSRASQKLRALLMRIEPFLRN